MSLIKRKRSLQIPLLLFLFGSSFDMPWLSLSSCSSSFAQSFEALTALLFVKFPMLFDIAATQSMLSLPHRFIIVLFNLLSSITCKNDLLLHHDLEPLLLFLIFDSF